jgi:Flp pilus assembly protein TadG
MRKPHSRRVRVSGGSLIEFSLLLPWVIFLFVGAFDWGFYAHALISTEDAARVAALYGANNGGGGTTTACTIVLDELSISANVTGLTAPCPGPVTDTAPVAVSLTCTTLDSVNAVKAQVAYRTLQLIPIPWLLSSKVTLNRMAEAPIANNGSCSVTSS